MEPQGAHGQLTLGELLPNFGWVNMAVADQFLDNGMGTDVMDLTASEWQWVGSVVPDQKDAMVAALSHHDAALAERVAEWLGQTKDVQQGLGPAESDSGGAGTLREVATEADVPVAVVEQAAAQVQEVQMLDIPYEYLPIEILARLVTQLPQDDGVAFLNQLVKISSQSKKLLELLKSKEFKEALAAAGTLKGHDDEGFMSINLHGIEEPIFDDNHRHVYVSKELDTALSTLPQGFPLAVHFPLTADQQANMTQAFTDGSLKELELYAGAALDTVSVGEVHVYDGGTVTTVNGGTVSVSNGGTVTTVTSGEVNVHSGGTVTGITGGSVNVWNGGTVTLGAGVEVIVDDDTGVHTADGSLTIAGSTWNAARNFTILAADGTQLYPRLGVTILYD